jgi:ribosomal protein S18 acetylase RimI-like enzyme
MASIAVPIATEHPGPLRPLNILRDLPQVADLIELCFEMTMDDDGQSYVQQMRKASADRDFLTWANKVMESTSMPLAGFVWEEDGKIVGNVSLVFQAYRGRKMAMIANVATHPGYRRRGIGRALTERAMLAAGQKGSRDIWLQVRQDNPTAIRIYADLGFVERARRTTYYSRSTSGAAPTAESTAEQDPAGSRGLAITHRPSGQHWDQQRAWLEGAHPEELGWYARWDWSRLGPGLANTMYRLFVQFDVRQWCACLGRELRATATWVPTYRVPNALWLAASPEGGIAVTRVLEAARRDLAHYRKVSIEYPAGQLRGEIEAAGFEELRTLLWMRATPVGQARMEDKKET